MMVQLVPFVIILSPLLLQHLWSTLAGKVDKAQDRSNAVTETLKDPASCESTLHQRFSASLCVLVAGTAAPALALS